MNKHKISFTVNSLQYTLQISPNEKLLHVLRNRLRLTGTKEGCGIGQCGSCIVIKDGKTINSCLTLALECNGANILTVEAFGPILSELHPLQESFIKHGAVQCGFCTPGMLMTAKNLLDHNPRPTRKEIKLAISGNLCRCTGYEKIIDAIEAITKKTLSLDSKGESYIGRSTLRGDSVQHVKGLSLFGDDVIRPNMIYGKILRSKHAHARIKHIDTGRAEKLNGVLAVVTGKEISQDYFGVDIKDRLVFATDKVRYRGDAVAAVAAVSEEIASKALNLIKVKYEPLESVFDVRKAMVPDAPVIHDKLGSYECSFETKVKGNICTIANVKLGNLEKGFSKSDVIIEDTYTTQIVHQCSLETHASIAEVDTLGRITVWTTTQKPFAMRRYLSHSLKIPINQIRIIASNIGGGFGGKLEMIVEPYCVVLARRCRRPVKIVYSREEEFLATTPRHQTYFWIRSGIKKDGTLTAQHIKLIYDTGAYSGNGPATVTLSSQLACGLYRIPNLLIEGYLVYTNKMNCGSMRGPSSPQTTFAIESHMDNLAKNIGMDPLDFRLKNLLENGEKTGFGQTLVDTDFKKVTKAAADAIGWKSIKKSTNSGKGMACTFWLSGGWSTSASVKINEDGTATLVTGAVDMGTGYLYTGVLQIVAEELGILIEDVNIVQGDTDVTSYDHGIGGSRGVFTIGRAAQMAAARAKKELFQEAAQRFGVRLDNLETKNGWIYLKDDSKTRISFGEISMGRHMKDGGPVTGSVNFLPEMDAIDPKRVEGFSFSAFKGITICCHMAVVQVMPETGKIEIKRYVAAHDVGRAINPQAIEGQIEGGISMGLGFALMEKLIMDKKGNILNPNFQDYKIPTSLDVPKIESVIAEVPAAYGPHGVKGVGEPTTAPTAAAVGNAIFDATGARMRETPMTPESLFKEISKKK